MDVDIQQEQHIIIKFLVAEDVSGAEIHCRLLAVFKSETLSRSSASVSSDLKVLYKFVIIIIIKCFSTVRTTEGVSGRT